MRCSTRCESEDIAGDESEAFGAVDSRRADVFRLHNVRDIIEQVQVVGLRLLEGRKWWSRDHSLSFSDVGLRRRVPMSLRTPTDIIQKKGRSICQRAF